MAEDVPTAELVSRYLSQVREMYGDEIYLDISNRHRSSFSYNSLDGFEAGIRECQKCPLGETRTKFVFGVGDPDADLVLVGEAPGRDEDLRGEPFVGRAGQLLDRILAAIDFTREQVYICNVIKCRPPNNRTPASEEIETCLPYLEEQLEMIRPKLIVALGATAARVLISVKSPLAQLRSKLWKWREVDVVVTYHPAALLRNPGLKRVAWEDFQWIRQVVEGN